MIRFDLRVPDFAATTHAEQYRACLEMCEWAEGLGFDAAVLSEHHGTPDGYLPAPVPFAAAVLARTNRIPVNIAAVLAPFHDPVRLAEQLAVVDLVAPGRISVVAAVGYRRAEFEMAGIPSNERGARLEEAVRVLRAAWTGEPFEYQGREIVVRPTPATPGGPMIMIGGGTEPAARRAARLRCGFFPSAANAKLAEWYADECEKVGFAEGFCGDASGPAFVHIAEDPDMAWEQIGPHALFDAQSYASWQEAAYRPATDVPDATTWQDVRDSGVYRVLTPDEAVELSKTSGGGFMLHPLMGGIPPDLAWRSLELFEHKVLPEIRPTGVEATA
jgi:alkanesulfonate monooxygenase SsuD/methylene tetrahydromethanopterin reductase-like flavin-dependent oxidoreductase (luciferase family)